MTQVKEAYLSRRNLSYLSISEKPCDSTISLIFFFSGIDNTRFLLLYMMIVIVHHVPALLPFPCFYKRVLCKACLFALH